MAPAQDRADSGAASDPRDRAVTVSDIINSADAVDALPPTVSRDSRAGPISTGAIRRPDVRHMLWYVLGGSLPERNWTWVLHDTTCRTWALRQLGRPLMVLAPVAAAYVVFVPGALGLRLITGLTWSGGIMLYMFVNMLVDNDRRAVRAGYVSGVVADIRGHRGEESHHLAVVARNARAARRRARRDA